MSADTRMTGRSQVCADPRTGRAGQAEGPAGAKVLGPGLCQGQLGVKARAAGT